MRYVGANAPSITNSINGGTISNATLDSSVTFPAGTVLQVVHTETTETNTLDTTYTNYFEVPLTLKSSSSDVIVSFTFQYEIASGSSGFGVKIYRNTSSGVTTSDTEVWIKNPTNTTIGPFTVFSSYFTLCGVSTVTGKDSITSLNAGDTIYYALFSRAFNSSSTIYFPADSSTNPENGFFSSLIMEVQK